MRLIGDFDSEKQAYFFYSFLTRQGIQNSCESYVNPQNGSIQYRIWVYNEEDLARAEQLLADYRQDPSNAQFRVSDESGDDVPPLVTKIALGKSEGKTGLSRWKIKADYKTAPPYFPFTLTNFILLVCIFLYFLNSVQETKIAREKGAAAVELGMTPVQSALIFDYPVYLQLINKLINTYPLQDVKNLQELPEGAKAALKDAEAYPDWKGFYAMVLAWKQSGWKQVGSVPTFEKIREGQVWRLFTPCLLHRDFLHILFNMAWLWFLGRQIEQRTGRWRMALMVLVIGVVANIFQYLMSGPYFLGFSGVVVGMVGFIWMRQKIAPWEGYPLTRGTVLFIVYFVGAMFLLEIVSFFLQFFKVTELSPNIANTAHIIGGLTGLVLGKLPIFARKKA